MEDEKYSPDQDYRIDAIRQSLEALRAAPCDLPSLLEQFGEVLLREVADFYAVDLVGDDGSIHRPISMHRDPEKARLLHLVRVESPLSVTSGYGYPRVIKTGKSQFLPALSPRLLERLFSAESMRVLTEKVTLRSLICAPLNSGDRTLGALTLGLTERGRLFAADDLLVTEMAAQLLAEQIDRDHSDC